MLSRHLTRPRQAIAKPPQWGLYRRRLHDIHNPASQEAALTTIHEASGLFATVQEVTGLPWLATIPLVAVGFRSLIYFLLSRPARINRQRMADVRNIIHTQTMAKVTATGNIRRSPKHIKESVAQTQKICYYNWGVDPRKRWYPLLQLPLFLFIMEDIRNATGAPTGLLGAMKQRVVGLFGGGTEASVASELAKTPDVLDPIKLLQEVDANPATTAHVPSAPQATKYPDSTASEAAPTTISPPNLAPSFDPSLTTGGPFWCPDLTALDPTLFLPLAIPTIMCVNAIYSGREQLTGSGARGAFSRFLVVLPMAMLFVTVKLPAGMLLYWFCSATIGLATQVWSEIKHPLHEMGGKGFKPLKRVFRGSIQKIKVRD